MSQLFKSIENTVTGNILNIFYEEYAENPRDLDFTDCNVSRFIFKNGTNETMYPLEGFCNETVFENEGDAIEKISKDIKKYFGSDLLSCTPIYKYEHSGIVYSLTPFSCNWDSGLAGFMIILKSDVRKLYSKKRISKQLSVQALESAYAEFKTFNHYVQGNVFRYEVFDKRGQDIDSCGGFYGDNMLENGLLDHVPEFKKAFQGEITELALKS